MSDINYTSGNQVANAIDKRIIAIAKQVANKSSVNRTVYGRVTAKNNALFSVKINNTVYTNVVAFKDLGYINVGDTVVCLVPNNQFNNLLILGVADGTFASSSIYELNQASSTELGGVKANNRTVENQEVKIDPNTGFLYYSVGKSIDSIEKTSTSGLVDTYTITFTDGSFTTFTVTNADQINIRYTNGQLQWKYATETTWNTLFSIDNTLSNTSTNPIQNQAVSNAITEIRNNMNNNVVKNISTTISGDNFSLIQTLINLNTQATTQQSINIPLANATTAGLMSSSDFSSLQDLEDRVGNLEGKTTRLLYTASTDPTASDINSFVTGLGYTSPFEGIAVVVDETFHIWHYYEGNVGWKDDGIDTVSNFTNSTAGIILGSTESGKVFAETDGTGSINGWDDLTTTVENLNTSLTDVIENKTVIYARRESGEAAGFRAGGNASLSGNGGAIGLNSIAGNGGAIGEGSQANIGGAVGYQADTIAGGAVGSQSNSVSGGAIGNRATTTAGGAVGSFSVSGNGFAGGLNAKTQDASANPIDAVQLGTGTNTQPKTLQIYNDNIYNATTHTLNVENILENGNSLLNQNQGIENVGKVMVVGSDGNLTPETFSSGGTTVTVNGQAQTTWEADTKVNVSQGTSNAGKILTIDNSGNVIPENISDTQVIRTDIVQSLTDADKQQAQKNITHTAWQNHANSGVQVGWYQVANLKMQGNYDIKIKQSYSYTFPEAIHLSISINDRLYTGEPFASITQLSGVTPGAFSLSKIRVRQGTDEGTTFLDVYNPEPLWNTTWVDITSDSQYVVVEPNSPFQFIGTEDNPSGYKISSLDLVTGFNTNTPLKSDGNVIVDTRSVSSPPSYYADQQTCYEFKARDTLGLAEYMPNSDYVVLTTKKGWTGDGYIVYQEAVSAGSDAGAIDDSIVCYRYGRLNSWGEWKTVGTFLPYEFNKKISFGGSGYLYIGKFPIYDTNITVDISCTTSTTYSGKLVIACQNHVIMKASVFGDYSNTVTSSIYYKLIDNTVEVYFKPQAWSKNVIHITGCGIQGEVTHVCEKISAIPTDATSQPENEYGKVTVVSNGYYIKHGDGTMEQHFTVTGSRGNMTPHTFLQPFKSGTTPIVHRTIDIDGSGNAQQLRGWNISNLTNTGFSIYTTDISGATTSMISAYGYWK